jgi:hypothetical protein
MFRLNVNEGIAVVACQGASHHGMMPDQACVAYATGTDSSAQKNCIGLVAFLLSLQKHLSMPHQTVL